MNFVHVLVKFALLYSMILRIREHFNDNNMCVNVYVSVYVYMYVYVSVYVCIYEYVSVYV